MYTEGRWRAVVQVLEHRSDDAADWYRLRVLVTLQHGAPFCEPAPGSEFEFYQRRGIVFNGMGQLQLGYAVE